MAMLALATFTIAASAQQPGGATAAQAKTKIAFIDVPRLQEGVLEYRARIEALNKQFEPRVKEIQGLTDRISALETTIKTQAGLTPARVAELTDQIETMKREQKRKSEDLQADGEKATSQSLSPINEKLGKALANFSTKRGIWIVINAASAMESQSMLWYDRRADITEEFIREYNAANPVTAAPATPATTTPR